MEEVLEIFTSNFFDLLNALSFAFIKLASGYFLINKIFVRGNSTQDKYQQNLLLKDL